MINDIINYNPKGQDHGYHEFYMIKKNKQVLCYRCNWKNGQEIGYDEWHDEYLTQFFIK